jgi:hypothetical protein
MAQGTPVLAFNISLGAPLAECPLVADALQILELCGGESPFEHASRIVRSPFIAGGELEREARARLDARLRKRCAPAVKLDALRRQCSAEKSPPARSPSIASTACRCVAEFRHARRRQWAKVAEAGPGFPGSERPIDEHQALARCRAARGIRHRRAGERGAHAWRRAAPAREHGK